MDIINIIFGCVTVIAFIYAIITNRRADSIQQLTKRLTVDVRSIALTIYELNKNTPTEGYAKSIVHILESLIQPRKNTVQIGQVKVKYRAYELPPLHTHCGSIVDDTETFYGRAIKGRIEGEREKGLIYGPYEKLPVTGLYRSCFRIKGTIDSGVYFDKTLPVARLDIYNYQGVGRLSERLILLQDLQATYTDYDFQFRYDDVMMTLEYRVAILQPHVELLCEEITIERVSS